MPTRARYLGEFRQFKDLEITFIETPVYCGVAPGPPESMKERRILLADLVDHPNDTYFWIAFGDSMSGARIISGDILVIDKRIIPVTNDIIIAGMPGYDPMVKRLGFEGKRPLLLPDNPAFKPIPIDPDEGVKCMGVVTFGIYSLRGTKALSYKLKR